MSTQVHTLDAATGAVIEADENPDEQYFEPATKAAIAAAADQNKEE